MSETVPVGYQSDDLSVDSITIGLSGEDLQFDPTYDWVGGLGSPSAVISVDGSEVASAAFSVGGNPTPRIDQFVGATSVTYTIPERGVSIDVTGVVEQFVPEAEPPDIQILTRELFGEVDVIGDTVQFITGESLSQGRQAAFRLQVRNFGGEEGSITVTGSVAGQQVINETVTVPPTGSSIERGFTFTTPPLSGETVQWSFAGASGTATNEDYAPTGGSSELEVSNVAATQTTSGFEVEIAVSNNILSGSGETLTGEVVYSVDGVNKGSYPATVRPGQTTAATTPLDISPDVGEVVEVCASIR